jgi:putative copper resistance protein D
MRRTVLRVTVVGRLLGGWELAPVPATGLLLTVAAYLVAARVVRLRTPDRPWPAARTACFLGGALVAAVAVLGPPATFDDVFFSAHMVEHLLLTMVAVPLLVLGDPVLLALRAVTPEARRRWLVPALRSRVAHTLTRPLLGWVFFTVVMVGTHVPAVYDLALTHPVLHDYVEHPLYVVSALVFFYPLLSPTPGPARVAPAVRVLSLFTAMAPPSFTGFFIYISPHVDYPFYAHVARPFGPGPLTDQQLSGALMWSTTMALTVAWVCLAGVQWLRDEASRTRRLDRALSWSSS